MNKNRILNLWKRFRLNSKYIFKKSGSWLVGIYAVLGFVAMFVPLDEFLPSLGIDGFWCQLLASVLILAAVFILCFVVATIYVLGKKRVKVLDGRNGKSVYVVYGNVFDEKIVPVGTERRSICFAVNRCFDTVVDNTLISSSPVHGQALKWLYDQNKGFDAETLNAKIQSRLSKNGEKSEKLTREKKPAGNLDRYSVGTGVDLPISDALHFFMIGIGIMNERLKNHADPDEYCQAVQKMIEFIDTYSQGYPVILPIIGAGLTRLPASEKDLLKYLIHAFALNTSSINSDIYIVVREEAMDSIAIADMC